VSFAALTLYVAFERVIPKISLYFFIDSVRKLLDTLSYFIKNLCVLYVYMWMTQLKLWRILERVSLTIASL